MKYPRLVVSAVAASALSLAACSPSEEASDQDNSTTTTAQTEGSGDSTASSSAKSAEASAGDLTFEDGVVRAMAEDSDMTAIFGTLVNHTDSDLEVESFSSSIKAKMNELHETVDGQMREMDGPMTIPAGGKTVLKPGGDHLMLMGVEEPVMAGESVTVTLHLTNGEDVELGEIPVRTMGAGDEDYGDLEGHDGHGDHSGHGAHGDHSGHGDHGDHSGHAGH